MLNNFKPLWQKWKASWMDSLEPKHRLIWKSFWAQGYFNRQLQDWVARKIWPEGEKQKRISKYHDGTIKDMIYILGIPERKNEEDTGTYKP